MKRTISYKLSNEEKGKLAVLLAFGLAVVGFLYYSRVWLVVLLPVFWRPAACAYEQVLGRRRRKQLRMQFQDFLGCLGSSLDVGRHFQEALSEAMVGMGKMYGEDEPMMAAAAEMEQKMLLAGASDVQVLVEFAEEADLEDVDNFLQVYRACRQSGGDLSGAVRKCALQLQEKLRIEQEIELMISQKRYEGRIITLMPALILLFLRIVSPAYLEVLYRTFQGVFMMTVCLALTVASYWMIDRITDIEV